MNNNLFKKILRPASQAAIFLLVSLTVCVYLAEKIDDISDEATEKRGLQYIYQNSREQFGVLSEDYQKISSHVDTVNNFFPTTESISVFIDAMERLAAKNNLTQTFRFETSTPQPTDDAGLSGIPFNVVLMGAQSQFIGYLADIEMMPYLTKIESLNISSQPDGSGQMNIRGLLYIRK